MPININIPRTPPFLRSPDPNTPKKKEEPFNEDAHQAYIEALRNERERADRCVLFTWDHNEHKCVDMYGLKLDGLTVDELQRRPTLDKIWSKKLDASCFHTSTTPCKCGLGHHHSSTEGKGHSAAAAAAAAAIQRTPPHPRQ